MGKLAYFFFYFQKKGLNEWNGSGYDGLVWNEIFYVFQWKAADLTVLGFMAKISRLLYIATRKNRFRRFQSDWITLKSNNK